MTDGNIYKDIAERTGGEVYAGVVGPVRTGKSTFIKRFMELFVVPAIENTYVRTRVVDQLPQSGDGRTITTTEPKFIPEEAVAIKVSSASLSIRMVDCVGYLIPGVLGHQEDGKSRMVKTPWDAEGMPFEEAAERGTEKVITEHSTVGIMITCDGSFGEIPRENYIMAEEKTVSQLKQLGKPFVIVLNSSEPSSHRTAEMAKKMEAKYSAPVIAANCATMDKSVPEKIFDQLLSQFPVSEIFIDLPEYMDALPQDHEVKAGLVDTMLTFMKTVDTVSSVESSLQVITANENVKTVEILRCEMATGRVFASVKLKDGLYYQIIGELLRHPVNNDRELFLLMREYARAKQAYDDMKEALDSVTRSGYGIVHPKLQQMKLGEPVTAGAVMVDGLGVGDVGNVVMRDRRHLSQDGLVIVVATVSADGQLLAGPDLVSRGFVYVRENESLMDGAQSIVENALERCVDEHVRDWNSVKTRVREALSSYIYRRTKRSPMILPILMEV